MGLETGTYLDDLVITNPTSADKRRFGDDHLRLIKTVLKNTFPNVDDAINPTPAEFNYLVGVTSGIQAQLDLKLVASDIANMAEKNVAQAFTEGQWTAEEELSYAASITPDADDTNAFRLIATGNFTLNTPTNGGSGQVITIFIQQDSQGSRVMTLSGFYGRASDDLVLSTTANALDLLTLIKGTSDNRWYVVSLKKDINSAL